MGDIPNQIAHYRIEEIIDRGSMGVVYRGIDTRLGRVVAIKALPAEFATDERRRRRLSREARLLALVSHPGLAAIYSIEEDAGRPYLILEYVPGESLAQRLNRGKLPVEESLRIALAVAGALAAAHQRGVVHRDLKPANIRVTPQGVVKLLDFGLARELTDPEDTPLEWPTAEGRGTSAPGEVDLTDQNALVGTVGYMSPEQLRHQRSDPRSDVWAFGCVMFECLTGTRTWGAGSANQRAFAILSGEPDWSLLPESTPSTIRGILERCLRKDPEFRPALKNLVRVLEEAVPPADAKSRAPATEVRSNIPSALTSFIGRERESEEVYRLVRTTRLVTLTGPGGCGKTRLVFELGADLARAFRDGAWMVDLSTLPAASPAAISANPADQLVTRAADGSPTTLPARTVAIAAAIGAAVGVRDAGREGVETLTRELRGRELLLVLDNCEHLAAEVAAVAAVLLASCPELSVLATSREPLGIAGEALFELPPLTTPDPARLPPLERLEHYESIRLFVERAVRVSSLFALTEANARDVTEICRRLDGLPLAIELAAARVRSIPVGEIAGRLNDRFALLTGGSRAAPARHQTLRALIDWSYEHLEPGERAVLRRLAVFAGSFALETAEHLLPDALLSEGEILDHLAHLLDRSLVRAERNGELLRYRLLETVRAYAAERLAEAGEEEATRRRHRDWCCAIAEQADRHLHGRDQLVWTSRLEEHREDLSAALAWSATAAGAGDEALRLAGSLLSFWESRGPIGTSLRLVEAVLAADPAPRASLQRARALNAAGSLASFSGDYAGARRHLDAAHAMCLELGDDRALARSYRSIGKLAFLTGNIAEAERTLEQTLAIRRRLGEPGLLAATLNEVAGVRWRRGDAHGALDLCEQALALYREVGDLGRIATLLGNLGNLMVYLGQDEPARLKIEESRSIELELGNRRGVAFADQILALVLLRRGEHAAAHALAVAAVHELESVGYRRGHASALAVAAMIDVRRGEIADATTASERALTIALSLGNPLDLAEILRDHVRVAHARGEFEMAGLLLGVTEGWRENLRAHIPAWQREEVEALAERVREQLGDASFEKCFAAGQALSLEDAARHVLASRPRD